MRCFRAEMVYALFITKIYMKISKIKNEGLNIVIKFIAIIFVLSILEIVFLIKIFNLDSSVYLPLMMFINLGTLGLFLWNNKQKHKNLDISVNSDAINNNILWIRTQDKQELLQVANFSIQRNYGGKKKYALVGTLVVNTLFFNQAKILGFYKTKPEAIQELNRIQKYLEDSDQEVYQVN